MKRLKKIGLTGILKNRKKRSLSTIQRRKLPKMKKRPRSFNKSSSLEKKKYRIKFRNKFFLKHEIEMYSGLKKYKFGEQNNEWDNYKKRDMISDVMFYHKLKTLSLEKGKKKFLLDHRKI